MMHIVNLLFGVDKDMLNPIVTLGIIVVTTLRD